MKLVAQNSKSLEQLFPHRASSTVEKEGQKGYRSDRETFSKYRHKTLYMEAVCSMVKEIYGRQPDDPMKDSDVNLAIWSMFMNTTLQATVELVKDNDMSLSFVESSLEISGTAFHGNRNACQWSDRNR